MLFYFKGGFIKGLVSRIESKDYYVFPEGEDKVVRCSLKGKFKKDFQLKKDKLYRMDMAAVGDNVEFEFNKDGTGVITKIDERQNYISRKAPKIKGASYRGERLEQIIAANIDNLFIVSSTFKPDFNNKVIDRFIVSGESSNLHIIIIINKIDLDNENLFEDWINLYRKIGYEVIVTSKISGEGIEKFKNEITGKKNILWGHSGVGKSSLLNKIFPGLNLEIGEISSYSDKGTHKTVTSKMIKITSDTYVIDTPGVREIDPFGIKKKDLGYYFIEFKPFAENCRFSTCTHFHEPECNVIKAVENKEISEFRYESYLRILDTIEEGIIY
ncbi:MAG TPA: ribosome small subunit-dependent GTPase A [Ignavibacteriaceae bacterium]|nr:ribosome small subunit-dependent GTPase A [Ignavibacteriaceae bacterium]